MRLRYVLLACALAVPLAIPQNTPDGQARARDYVQFLVQELDQWTRDFPQAYNMALVRPPVDPAALSEAAKAGAANLRETVAQLAALSGDKDLMGNPGFKSQLGQTLLAAAPVNEALSKQRFPEGIVNDWSAIRTSLNSLAGVYKIPQLPVLEAPAASPEKSEKRVAAIPAGALTAWVVDQSCAARGKGMWANAQCVQKCVRDGDKVVLVTEQGKVIQIANQEKIEAESYGRMVAVTGKTDGDTMTVATLQIL
jgi:hypothetical protein